MDNLEAAGEALLQAHEGSRQIALAVWGGLRAAGRRIARFLGAAISQSPGPHMLP